MNLATFIAVIIFLTITSILTLWLGYWALKKDSLVLSILSGSVGLVFSVTIYSLLTYLSIL